MSLSSQTMSQINPNIIIEKGIIEMSDTAEVQQVGIDLSLSENIMIPHGRSLNVSFKEKINLPQNIFSTFNIRSSFSRKGIFATTGIYDPGYVGSLGCTLYNISGSPIQLEEGERVGQMLFFIADAASSYSGQWQNT